MTSERLKGINAPGLFQMNIGKAYDQFIEEVKKENYDFIRLPGGTYAHSRVYDDMVQSGELDFLCDLCKDLDNIPVVWTANLYSDSEFSNIHSIVSKFYKEKIPVLAVELGSEMYYYRELFGSPNNGFFNTIGFLQGIYSAIMSNGLEVYKLKSRSVASKVKEIDPNIKILAPVTNFDGNINKVYNKEIHSWDFVDEFSYTDYPSPVSITAAKNDISRTNGILKKHQSETKKSAWVLEYNGHFGPASNLNIDKYGSAGHAFILKEYPNLIASNKTTRHSLASVDVTDKENLYSKFVFGEEQIIKRI